MSSKYILPEPPGCGLSLSPKPIEASLSSESYRDSVDWKPKIPGIHSLLCQISLFSVKKKLEEAVVNIRAIR